MSQASYQAERMIGSGSVIVTLVLLLFLSTPPAFASDEDQAIQFPLKEIWRHQVEQYEATANQRAILTTPIADDLRIFYASANGTCGALFKRNGEVSWIFHSSEPLVKGLLRIEGGPLVVASATRVFALNRDNGLVLWVRRFDEGLSTSISGGSGGLFICLQDARIIKLDAGSGAPQWTFNAPTPVTSTPLVSDGLFLCGDANGEVSCINAADGSELWKFSAGGAVRSGFLVSEGRVFFGSDDNYLYCLDLDGGGTCWRVRAAGDVNGYPVCSERTVYVSASDRTLRAYRISNGHARRGSPLQLTANIDSPIFLSNKQILFARKKELVAIDAETLKEKGKFAAPEDVTTSVLRDPASGALYFGCRSGVIIAALPEVIAARQVTLQPIEPQANEVHRTGVELIPPESKPETQETKPAEEKPSEAHAEEGKPVERTQEEPQAQPESEQAAKGTEPAEPAKTEEATVVEEAKPEATEPKAEEVTPSISPEEALELAPVATSEGDLERAALLWRTALADKAETTYTVAIGLFCRREAVLDLISRLSGREVLIFDRRRGDQTCFFVCLGRFATREFAESFIETLDDLLKRQNPSAYRLDSFIQPER